MSIIHQDKYDYSQFMESIKSDFGLSEEEVFVIRQSNEYVAFVYCARQSLKTKNMDKYEVFELGMSQKEVTTRKNNREVQEVIKFNRFMVVYKLDKNGKFPAIDLKEYVQELIESGSMNPELLEFSLGYDVENSGPVVIKLYGAGEGFMPNYIGQPRSGKGINMRALIYQLAMFPLSEFLIFDKGKDLLSIHNAKKTIFQMDIEDISGKPSRLINFFTYLIVYYQYKSNLLNKFGYIDYKTYYKDFLRQKKEGVAPGEKVLPTIPYTIIIYDEIKRQRANFIEKLGKSGADVFDNLIGSFLNVAPFAGFKMIGATQEPNISSMGQGFKALANIFFRIKYDVSDGVSTMNSKILNSDSVKNARLMNYNDIWIKPPFAKGADNAMNQYLTETMNGATYLPERHYTSVNDLFKSLSVDGSTSVILSSYHRIFQLLHFTDEEIEEIEASDEFFIYVVLAFYMYRSFSIAQLKPNLPVREAVMNFEGNIDNTLFKGFMPLVSKDKEETIRKVLLGTINDNNAENAEIFLNAFGNMMHGWYELEIRKSGISDLYGFENFKPSNNLREDVETTNVKEGVSVNQFHASDLANNVEKIVVEVDYVEKIVENETTHIQPNENKDIDLSFLDEISVNKSEKGDVEEGNKISVRGVHNDPFNMG